MKTTPKRYRVIQRDIGFLTSCKYEVEKLYGDDFWDHLTYTDTKWGAKLEIKRDKRRRTVRGTTVYESE